MLEVKSRESQVSVWNYEESVAKVKVLVYKKRNLDEEIVGELRIARQELSAQGRRIDFGTYVPKLPAWADYCQAIGVDKWQS